MDSSDAGGKQEAWGGGLADGCACHFLGGIVRFEIGDDERGILEVRGRFLARP